jgi:CRP/FNR family transcriptional regulator, nitrogen fixation regulation protein
MSAPLAVSADGRVPGDRAPIAEMPSTTSPSTQERPDDGVLLGGRVLHFAPDQEIYTEGAEAKSFYKIASGVVRTCKFLNDGRRQIDSFHVTGDLFGFEVGAEHRLAAEAVSDCTVIPYRRRGLEALAATDARLARQLFSHAMQCLERAQEHSLLLARRSAAQKLAAFLLQMADRRGAPEDEVVDLAMTRQDIADYLGLTIETVSRTLSQLERDAVIALPTARRIRLISRMALRSLNS